MHPDRLRFLVSKTMTLDGAVEIAKAAPALLKLIEDLERENLRLRIQLEAVSEPSN